MSPPAESAAPVDSGGPQEQLREPADRIAAVVRAVPGVADLNGGRFGEFTTYLPGRRVAGVADHGDRIVVAVTADAGGSLIALAGRIGVAVAHVDARPLETVIEDIDIAGE